MRDEPCCSIALKCWRAPTKRGSRWWDRWPMHRIAVVGAGQFGQNHCRIVRQSSRAELTAVVDTDATRGTIAYYRELAGRVDGAIIATPTSAHAEIGCWLLEHGID